ncbi:MAG: PspC domain-containing protein [Coriobacteriales bacterium]|jgi:phage shock protein PspC (stress-responsive transcriptional regulator)|nr:PspC domain-containing protein [Coriobacteriales bacterium]
MSVPKRLYRSNDPVIAGVCGGIADYFGVDATFVRVLAVALLVVSIGSFVLFYLVAMILIPRDPAANDVPAATAAPVCVATGAVRTATGSAAGPVAAAGSAAAHVAAAHAAAGVARPSGPAAVGFGPSVGAASGPAAAGFGPAGAGPTAAGSASAPAGVGPTAAVPASAPAAAGPAFGPAASPSTPAAGALKKRWSTAVCMGLLLICVGILALLANLINLSFWRLWPLALVVVGIAQLFTPSSCGWSLERAGGAIVLISFGLLAQALMLGLVSTHAVLVAFGRLWPMLLVVLGLLILASARKQEAFSLLASLLLSATMLLGVWLFGGISDQVTVRLVDGSEITLELPISPMPPADEASIRFATEVGRFASFEREP